MNHQSELTRAKLEYDIAVHEKNWLAAHEASERMAHITRLLYLDAVKDKEGVLALSAL